MLNSVWIGVQSGVWYLATTDRLPILLGYLQPVGTSWLMRSIYVLIERTLVFKLRALSEYTVVAADQETLRLEISALLNEYIHNDCFEAHEPYQKSAVIRPPILPSKTSQTSS